MSKPSINKQQKYSLDFICSFTLLECIEKDVLMKPAKTVCIFECSVYMYWLYIKYKSEYQWIWFKDLQNVGLHSEIADAQSTVRDISTLNFISHYFYLFSTRNIKYTKRKFQKFLVFMDKVNSDWWVGKVIRQTVKIIGLIWFLLPFLQPQRAKFE